MTNGWDRASRREAAEQFNLDWEEFQDRHDLSFPGFDAGRITLEQYLDRTLFHHPRDFSREEFRAFMLAQSKEFAESRAVLDEVTGHKEYFIGAINNEPLELNEYRIAKFNLRRNFMVFFSSCYLGARKPEERIFKIALEVTQRSPQQCIFIAPSWHASRTDSVNQSFSQKEFVPWQGFEISSRQATRQRWVRRFFTLHFHAAYG